MREPILPELDGDELQHGFVYAFAGGTFQLSTSGTRAVSPAADCLEFSRPPREFVPIAAPQNAAFFFTQPDDTRIPDS